MAPPGAGGARLTAVERVRTDRVLWAVLLSALVILPNLFALEQLRATGGYLFYANAFDETTYLSWDGARMARSPAH